MLSDEQVEFIERGRALLIGTRDARLVPDLVRGFCAKVLDDRRSLRLWVIESQAARMFANLEDNGQVAASLTQVSNYESMQLKGRYLRRHPFREEEREQVTGYYGRFSVEAMMNGIARPIVEGRVCWPCVAFDFAVREVWRQTPGPKAGQLIARFDEGGAR